MTVTPLIKCPPRELAHRVNDGVEVTLFWHAATDELTVCVWDRRCCRYFEVQPERRLALDAFHHPYAYAASSVVQYEDDPIAA